MGADRHESAQVAFHAKYDRRNRLELCPRGEAAPRQTLLRTLEKRINEGMELFVEGVFGKRQQCALPLTIPIQAYTSFTSQFLEAFSLNQNTHNFLATVAKEPNAMGPDGTDLMVIPFWITLGWSGFGGFCFPDRGRPSRLANR